MIEDIKKARLTCDWPNCGQTLDFEFLQGQFKLPAGWSWFFPTAPLYMLDVRLYCADPTHVR